MSQKTEKIREKRFCNICNYTANRSSDFVKHIKTQKHIKNSLVNNSEEITENKTCEKENVELVNYECLYCYFNTNDKKDYRRHLQTQKHKKNEEKNKLNDSNLSNINDEPNYKELFMNVLNNNSKMITTLIDENKELKKQLVEQSKVINEIMPKIGNNTINSNNKFNLNIFLNETCKDAISMEEFINKIEVSLSDLFYTKNKGIAEGVSNIFIENLNKIPITQRPIHCTDVKRETIYIKNEQWEKDENKEKTKDAIKKVSGIQIKNINKFKSAHPNFMENEMEKDNYVRIVNETTSNIKDKEDKVIKSICKNIYIKHDLLIEN